jgi:hypothetical protein
MVPIGAEPHYGILVIAFLSAVALRGWELVMSRVSDGAGAQAGYYAGAAVPRVDAIVPRSPPIAAIAGQTVDRLRVCRDA